MGGAGERGGMGDETLGRGGEMAMGGEGEGEGEKVGVWCEGEMGGTARGSGVGAGEKMGTRWDCDGISL